MARLAIFTERTTLRRPSEWTALSNFRLAAFDMGHQLDFLFRNEIDYLTRYDAVFIRSITDPRNATYIVARRAEAAGMRVLDHSESIKICCDKVAMYGRLRRAGVPIPATLVVRERDVTIENAKEAFAALGSPLVLKAPNGSFGSLVDKVSTPEAYVRVAHRFLRRADRLIVQQFVRSDFDWRVILLGGEVLAVVRYVFALEAWKTMDRSSSGEWCRVEAVPRGEADRTLLDVATRAADAIGRSLYGVDLKEVDGGFVVIEVNDNPTIAAGDEDQADGDVYRRIIEYLATPT